MYGISLLFMITFLTYAIYISLFSSSTLNALHLTRIFKGGRWVGLTNLPTSCADCLEIWETQPPGKFRACTSLYGYWFTITFTFTFTCKLCRHICQNLAEIWFYHMDVKSCREITWDVFKICTLYTARLKVDHIRDNMGLTQ